MRKKCELFAPKVSQVVTKNATIVTQDLLEYNKSVENKAVIVHFATEDVLEEETVTRIDIEFSPCLLLSQDDLIQVYRSFHLYITSTLYYDCIQTFFLQTVTSPHCGSLSRISFHYPPSFTYFDDVLTRIRFTKTKKDNLKYKFKQEDIIIRFVEGKLK